MPYRFLIITTSVTILAAVVLITGVYNMQSPEAGIVHRMNRFTGAVDICIDQSGCESLDEMGQQ